MKCNFGAITSKSRVLALEYQRKTGLQKIYDLF